MHILCNSPFSPFHQSLMIILHIFPIIPTILQATTVLTNSVILDAIFYAHLLYHEKNIFKKLDCNHNYKRNWSSSALWPIGAWISASTLLYEFSNSLQVPIPAFILEVTNHDAWFSQPSGKLITLCIFAEVKRLFDVAKIRCNFLMCLIPVIMCRPTEITDPSGQNLENTGEKLY